MANDSWEYDATDDKLKTKTKAKTKTKMKMMISIITPVYNTEKYLPECIDSILAQTYTDFEVLLIDDGSTDRSGEICDEYALKDARVRVFHKKNGGVSSARNVGLKNARGDWVCFVDSDDTVANNYLEVLLKAAIDNDADSAMGGYQHINTEKPVIIPTGVEGRESIEDNIKEFYACTPPDWQRCLWNRLFKMDIIRQKKLSFDEDIHSKEDGFFIIQFLCCSNGYVGCNPKVIYNYRQYPESTMGQTRECVFSYKLMTNPKGHNRIVKTLRENNFSKEVISMACAHAKSTTEWVRNIMYRSGNKKLKYNIQLELLLCDTLGIRDYYIYRRHIFWVKVKNRIKKMLFII